MKKVLKFVIAACGLLLVGVVGLFGYLYFVVLDDPFDNKEFNRETWIKFHRSNEPDNPRGEMYESLVQNYLKKGMYKEKVVEILGKPDFVEEDAFLSYNLGMWSGFRMDYDSLDLKFSADGQLVEFYRVQH